MRSTICGAVGLAAVGLLTLAPIGASAQKAESGLLGNKLWNRFSDVLRLQGQPTRIEVGAVTGGAPGAAASPGGMSAPGGPMMGGMMAPGGPAMGGSPYGGGGSGMGSMMARMYQGGGGGGKMGAAMNPYGGGGPLPGMGGMGIGGQDEGLGGGGPMPGMGGGQRLSGGISGGSTGPSEEGEITWVYEKGNRTNIFLFNKDGRLIQVSSFGYAGPAVTSRGVHLGDPIGKIYAKYGWTANITKDAAQNTMTLDYSKNHHVAYQLADRGKGYRVVGITVGITELGQLQNLAPGMDFSGARGMRGSMGMGAGPTSSGMMSPGGMMPGGMMRGRAGGSGTGGAVGKASN